VIRASVAALCIAVGAVAPAAAATHHDKGPAEALFGSGLLPGQHHTATITVAAARVPVTAYLQVIDLRQQCADDPCGSASNDLADELVVTARDADGATWTMPLQQLTQRRGLPGEELAAGHRESYQLTLSLPASAGNAYQDLEVSARLRWGGRATPDSSVLGEHETRGDGPSPSNASLPFTGFDAVADVVAALALIGAGCIALLSTRRRRSAKRS
jgi:hypothetical protein